jgi:hypothetical protein
MNSVALCRVCGCRFANSHTTPSHRCGTCQQVGHGQIECGNPHTTNLLQQYMQDAMPHDQQCGVHKCATPTSHSTAAHQCSTCLKYGHQCLRCPLCRVYSETWKRSYVDADCCVCYEHQPMHISQTCGHGLCQKCVRGLF